MNATATATARPAAPRIGDPIVNQALDALLTEFGYLTPAELAELIALGDVIGEADTINAGPVGLWLVDELVRRGIDAAAYSWLADLHIYDANSVVIGDVHIPEDHPLYTLEREVIDGDHPAITFQGESDPR